MTSQSTKKISNLVHNPAPSPLSPGFITSPLAPATPLGLAQLLRTRKFEWAPTPKSLAINESLGVLGSGGAGDYTLDFPR